MRQQDDRIGRLSLDELKRGGVVGPDGGLGYSEGYGGEMDHDMEELESDEEDEKPDLVFEDRRTSTGKGKGKSTAAPTPSIPGKKKAMKGNSTKTPQGPTTPSRGMRTVQLPPTTTPGGSNFNDLLRAAEMANDPRPPTGVTREKPLPTLMTSATRSTSRRERDRDGDSGDERGSPQKRARRGVGDSGKKAEKGSGDDGGESALDLLAQASQLEVAKGDSPQLLPSAVRFEGMLVIPQSLDIGSPVNKEEEEEEERKPIPSSPIRELGLAPAIDLRSSTLNPPPAFQLPAEDHHIDPALSSLPITTPKSTQTLLPSILSTPKPKFRPRAASTSFTDIHTPARQFQNQLQAPHTVDSTFGGGGSGMGSTDEHMGLGFRGPSPELGAYASPTGGTVPGLGKYVHLSNTMPARRIRSPYLKWTVEEVSFVVRKLKWDADGLGVG
jgi:hypothetical protein